MKTKYVFILLLSISILTSLVFSFLFVSLMLSKNDIPQNVKQIEIFDGTTKKVNVDSKDYFFSLLYFDPYDLTFSLRVETSSGSMIKSVKVDEPKVFYDLKVTVKESLYDSVILWIEKKEG